MTPFGRTAITLGALAMGWVAMPATLSATTLGIVTAPRGDGQLSRHARAVADHGSAHFDARVIDYTEWTPEDWQELDAAALWWHHVDSKELPGAMTRPEVVGAIRDYLSGGGGLLLSGYAVQYVVDLGLEDTPPSTISHEPRTADGWGYRQRQGGHAAFSGLDSTFITVSGNARSDNFVAWWDDPGAFSGTWLADTHDGGGKVAAGEYTLGAGHVLVTGAGAFTWGNEGRPNQSAATLSRFANNMLEYLGAGRRAEAPSDPAAIMDSLAAEGRRLRLVVSDTSPEDGGGAARWLAAHFPGSVLPLDDLFDDPSLLDGTDVLWWHETDYEALPPTDRNLPLYDHLRERVHGGMGLLLTGFAPMLAVPLGVETSLPTSVLSEPRDSGNWGYTPVCSSHPVLADFDGRFTTLSEGVPVRNIICWWDNPSAFSGIWMADTESRLGRVAMGLYHHGRGSILVTGTGAYDWDPGAENAEQGNLELLTARMLEWLSVPRPTGEEASRLAGWWNFEEDGSLATNVATGHRDPIEDIVGAPERRPGPAGRALFLDGFSNWVDATAPCAPRITDAVTISAWVAVEAYPPQNAGFVSQFDDNSGFFFGVTPYGEWGVRVKTRGLWQTAWAPERLERSRWLHVAARLAGRDGHVTLFLDGEEVARSHLLPGPLEFAHGVPLSIGRASDAGYVVELFRTGVLRGMIDEVKIWADALDDEEVRTEFLRGSPPVYPRASTAPARLAADPQRPVYHPIPEGSWTNEPHGLIQTPDGRWYMTYQKNPAGPYWAHIHWGNMASDDLLHWENLPIALHPEPGIDRAGVWSGHAAMWNDKLTLVYTAVDGARATVALAVEKDGEGTEFVKIPENPVIDGRPRGVRMEDFRDPFVWEEDGTWYLLIGAGIPGMGGTTLMYRSGNMLDWEYMGRFMDGDSANSGFYWEMPVFLPMGGRHWFGISELPGRNSWWTGTWEDEVFTPDFEYPRRLEIINHFLSPTVAQDQQGRTVAIGIIPETRSSEEQHRAGWAHTFSLPRLWSINEEGEFIQEPLPELASLRRDEVSAGAFRVGPGEPHVVEKIAGDTLEVELDIEFAGAESATIHLRRSPGGEEETLVTIHPGEGELVLDRTRSSGNMEVQRDVRRGQYEVRNNRVMARLFLDRSVVEGFLDGRGTFTTRVYPLRPDATGLALSAAGGDIVVHSARAWEMTPTVEQAPGLED